MERTGNTLQRLADWAVSTEASSRSSALIRIGLALLLWSRFASELILFRDLSPLGLVLSASFFASTTMMLVGVFSRWSTAWAAAVGFTMYYYFGYGLGREPWHHHHIYILIVATALCVLTPCGRSYSLDRWVAVRRAERERAPPPPERGNVWGLRLIVIQLSVLYFFTALDKTNLTFLSGARLEHLYLWYYVGSDYPQWPGFHELAVLAAVVVVGLEYALAFGMPFARTRRYLVWPGLGLHAAFYLMLPVYTYSVTMFVLYLAYFDADVVHRFIDRLSGVEASRLRA